MNNHADMRKQLSAYSGGDLEPAERIRLEEHLVGCSSCRAELADLQTSLQLIRTTPEAVPPAWLATRIMARVREQQRDKRSWLQRIFFPLHIKLPIEVAALLLVCVSGYYVARTMETELKQPALRQEIPAAAPETGRPVGTPQQGVPAAVPPASAPPPPAARKEFRPEENLPVRPSAPKAADKGAPHNVPSVPGRPSPQTAFAPAPPLMKEERGATAVESPYGNTGSFKASQRVEPAERAMPAAAEMKKKVRRAVEHDEAASEAARGASDAMAGAAQPQVRIRLNMNTPASAPGSLRGAVTRSGGSVIEDSSAQPHTIKVRIPSVRMGELLEQLGHLGRVLERPQTRDLPGMVELEIIW